MRHPSPSRDRSTLSATSSACTPVLLPPCSHFPVSPRNPNFSLFFMFFRQLHRDPNVLFAEYKLLHPLQYKIIVRVCDMDAMLSSVFSGYCAPYSPAKFFIQWCATHVNLFSPTWTVVLDVTLTWKAQWSMSLYQREEAKIQASVNLQNAKAESRPRKLEDFCFKGMPGVIGVVMWDSGVVLGKFLEHVVDSGMLVLHGKKIVELGSSYGLVGEVIVTDLPDRLRLLRKNIEINMEMFLYGVL
ncbi:hypothetical protein JHK84_033753 [Glycine max]|nr:hypothetical protein JHK85_034133 [Glycine max]KAG5139985.1 hypothetical protein JHK84_033753 [Glycine max]